MEGLTQNASPTTKRIATKRESPRDGHWRDNNQRDNRVQFPVPASLGFVSLA